MQGQVPGGAQPKPKAQAQTHFQAQQCQYQLFQQRQQAAAASFHAAAAASRAAAAVRHLVVPAMPDRVAEAVIYEAGWAAAAAAQGLAEGAAPPLAPLAPLGLLAPAPPRLALRCPFYQFVRAVPAPAAGEQYLRPPPPAEAAPPHRGLW
jgi:hypothetical protein